MKNTLYFITSEFL